MGEVLPSWCSRLRGTPCSQGAWLLRSLSSTFEPGAAGGFYRFGNSIFSVHPGGDGALGSRFSAVRPAGRRLAELAAGSF